MDAAGSARSGSSDDGATCEEILTVIANMLEFEEADLVKLSRDATLGESTTTKRQRPGSKSRRRGSRSGSIDATGAIKPQQQLRKHRPPPPTDSTSRADVSYKNPFHEVCLESE